MSWGRRQVRFLASAERTDGEGVVGGTRDALHVPEPLAWQSIATAHWDRDEEVLRVTEVAPYGEAQPVHVLPLAAPDRLLQLVRERITATFVLQQYVEVWDDLGARVIGRRAPGGGEIRWFVEYDEGLDPTDPHVARVVDAAVDAARSEVGA